ncbi:MAG TPA: glycosyltransferase [Gemmatimonadales bacterium]|nr:glycosyltransferase [Gemmatimonadales bacterium]
MLQSPCETLTDPAPEARSAVNSAQSARAPSGAEEPRRVLLVAPQPFYEDRGTCIAVREVAEALGLLGYRTDLLTYPIGRSVDLPGTTILRAPKPYPMRSVRIGFSLRKLILDAVLVRAFARQLTRARYDVIHAVEEAAFPAVVLGRRFGVPVLYDMQSSLPDQMRSHLLFRNPVGRGVLRRCERWLLERADVVVASSGLAEQARHAVPSVRICEWQFPSSRHPVASDAVRDLRQELRIQDHARVVLYSGSFEPYQGLSELLAAMPQVLRDVGNVVLVLVGGNPSACAEVREQAEAMGLGRSVRIRERQPRHRLPQFLALADLVVSPRAYGENAPLKVFDYLAAGKPIVASNPGAHRWVLAEDRALLVEHTPAALARGISAVLSDPGLAARLSAGARAFADRRLHAAGFVEAVGEIYEGLRTRAAAPTAQR